MTCTCNGTRDAQRWEYCDVGLTTDQEQRLKDLGDMGWEAYAVSPHRRVYLKRPKKPKYVAAFGARLEDSVCHPDNIKEKP